MTPTGGAPAERYGWARWARLGRPVYPAGPHRLRERFFFPGHPTGGGHAGFGFVPVAGWARRGGHLVVAPAGSPGWAQLRWGQPDWAGRWWWSLAGVLRR